MDNLPFQSAARLAQSISRKEISSSELLEILIQRYTQLNPGINAIVAVDFASARKQAKELDAALARGEIRGPLHGVPMTIKDTIEVAGMPCTAGAVKLRDHIPKCHARVVESLINAGAVIFGKTNVPLFAQDFQSFNDVYGQTNNPWDASRVPGGSSGGAAAALAAGLTFLEIGSDIGGSIRNPSHFCGVFGHKPTFDIVSLRGHIPPMPGLFPGDYTMSGDIAVIGPMARTAGDLKMCLELIAGAQKPQQTAWTFSLPPSRKKHVKEFKVGIWLDDPDFPVDSQVGGCLSDLVDRLAAAGARIEAARPEICFRDCHDIYVRLLTAVPNAGISREVFAGMQAELLKLDPGDKRFYAQLIRGATLLHRDWVVLDYLRLMMRQKWADYFTEFDVLLCPAAPVTAFEHDHSDFFTRTLTVNGREKPYADVMSAWAGLSCVSYLPATVAPAGLSESGLPVGVQIVGPYLEDYTPIAFANEIEKINGGVRIPPGFE